MNWLLIKTNIRKEFWEHKKTFLWLPLLIASLVIVTPILAYLSADFGEQSWMYKFERLAELAEKPDISRFSFNLMFSLFVPFIAVYSVVQLYYFITCLYDERRDMSILFWRSLPVTDSLTIGVKLVVGALLLPAIFMMAATLVLALFLLAFFALCTVLSLGYDLSLWGFWSNSGIVSNTLSIWLNLVPYALWLLPLYAWLMLVSMYAQKAPFLWATIPVVILLLVEGFVVHYFDLDGFFFSQLIFDYFSISHSMVQSYPAPGDAINMLPVNVLIEKVNIIALLIGAAFLYGTYWLRANRSHG